MEVQSFVMLLDWVQSWMGFANSGGLVGLSLCLFGMVHFTNTATDLNAHPQKFLPYLQLIHRTGLQKELIHRTDECSICFETFAAYRSFIIRLQFPKIQTFDSQELLNNTQI